jgi:very-short-patch-repair endonuclease
MGVVAKSRAMRKALTPPEARLWVQLKAFRSEGFQFRRQAPFRGYFLDFVCFSRRLVVEVDGLSHHTEAGAAHDRVRDAVLKGEGFRVLRIDNAMVRDDLEAVMTAVRANLQALPTRSLRDHPPHEGEGE